jgi:hypothetical protein
VLFSPMQTNVPKTPAQCRECKRLEREYQLAVGNIFSVVCTRFETLGEKLHQLYEWQGVRDVAIKAFYKHKKSHVRGRRES